MSGSILREYTMKIQTFMVIISLVTVSCVPSGGSGKKKSKSTNNNISSINSESGNASGSGNGSISSGASVNNCSYPSFGSNMNVVQMNGSSKDVMSGAAYMLGSHTSSNDVVSLGARVSVIVDNKVDKIILPQAKSNYGWGKKQDQVHFAIYDKNCPGNPVVVDFQSVKDNVLIQFAGSAMTYPLSQDFSRRSVSI